MFMATAVAICCKCVLAWPRERVRRSAKARTPWESVPAIPARLVYKRWPASLLCWTRAVWSASCWARGPKRSFRRNGCARVHRERAGQGRQVGVLKWTAICWSRRSGLGSFQPAEYVPCGHRTRLCAQSIVNWSRVYAPGTLACHPVAGRVGTDQADSVVGLAPDQELRVDIGRIHEMVPRGQLLVDKRLMNRCGTLHFMHRGRGRDHMGQEMHGVRVTGLGHVDHIPGPLCVAFGPKARVGIIRRFECLSARGQVLLGL